MNPSSSFTLVLLEASRSIASRNIKRNKISNKLSLFFEVKVLNRIDRLCNWIHNLRKKWNIFVTFERSFPLISIIYCFTHKKNKIKKMSICLFVITKGYPYPLDRVPFTGKCIWGSVPSQDQLPLEKMFQPHFFFFLKLKFGREVDQYNSPPTSGTPRGI